MISTIGWHLAVIWKATNVKVACIFLMARYGYCETLIGSRYRAFKSARMGLFDLGSPWRRCFKFTKVKFACGVSSVRDGSNLKRLIWLPRRLIWRHESAIPATCKTKTRFEIEAHDPNDANSGLDETRTKRDFLFAATLHSVRALRLVNDVIQLFTLSYAANKDEMTAERRIKMTAA